MTTDPHGQANSPALETATLGGGCFWCLEAIFERLPGVQRVVSGYAGGRTRNPTYQDVCGGETGHAEVIRIEFHPETISYDQILEVFWASHDPTTLNRQGADTGTQYRSIILTHDNHQLDLAIASRDRAGDRFADPIVTEIDSLGTFTRAEVDHQGYFTRNPRAGYCAIVIRPKIEKLEQNGTLPTAS
ncbi:MAG: peptide-methionine (S)-S-oxide reductase [Verrucomicrobia bacterium]|nr:MAG: peptide-methionine (S)-S-oxide reductase [Verrucomicrobiota bacterium]